MTEDNMLCFISLNLLTQIITNYRNLNLNINAIESDETSGVKFWIFKQHRAFAWACYELWGLYIEKSTDLAHLLFRNLDGARNLTEIVKLFFCFSGKSLVCNTALWRHRIVPYNYSTEFKKGLHCFRSWRLSFSCLDWRLDLQVGVPVVLFRQTLRYDIRAGVCGTVVRTLICKLRENYLSVFLKNTYFSVWGRFAPTYVCISAANLICQSLKLFWVIERVFGKEITV